MTYVSDRLVRRGVDRWTTGESGETTRSFVIATTASAATHYVVYSIEVPDIRAGDLIEFSHSYQFNNLQAYTAGVSSYVILSNSATGVKTFGHAAGSENIVLADATGVNIDDPTNYAVRERSGAYVAKKNLGTRYVNVCAYTYSTSSGGESATISQSYGRLEVTRTRKGGVAAGSLKDWTPQDLPTLRGWWRADKIAGLSDGGSVSSWVPMDGLSYTLDQGTGADQPLWYDTTSAQLINGHPVVYFDGSSDVLDAGDGAAWESDAQGSVIMVFKKRALSASVSAWSAGFTGSLGDVKFVRGNLITDGSIEMEQRENDTEDSMLTGTSLVAADTPICIEWSSNDTAYDVRVDGSSETLSVNTGSDSGDWFSSSTQDNFTIGAAIRNTGTVLYADINVAEVIVLSAPMDASDRISFARYITDRYNITMGT